MKGLAVLLIILGTGCVGNRAPHPSSPAPLLVFVSGEVNRPGSFPWTNGITAAEAIRQAGGFNAFALRSIMVIHWQGGREHFRLTPDLQFTNCIALKPGDMVHSPPW